MWVWVLNEGPLEELMLLIAEPPPRRLLLGLHRNSWPPVPKGKQWGSFFFLSMRLKLFSFALCSKQTENPD